MRQSERGNRKLRQLPKPCRDKRRFLFDSDDGHTGGLVEYILHGWDLDRATGLYRLFVEDDEGHHVLDIPIKPSPRFVDEPESVVFASADEITLPCVSIPDGAVTDTSKVEDQSLQDGKKRTFLVCACNAYLVTEWGKRSPMSTELSFFATSESGTDHHEGAASVEVSEDGDAVFLSGQRRALNLKQRRILAHYRKLRRKAAYIRDVCGKLRYQATVNCKLSAIFREADIRDALFVQAEGKEEYRIRATVRFRKP